MKICGLNPEEEMLGGNRNRDRLLRYINEGEKVYSENLSKINEIVERIKKEKMKKRLEETYYEINCYKNNK